MLKVEGDLRAVADTVAAIPDVDYVVITSGSYDLLVEVVAEDDEALLALLSDKIRSIPGVRSTDAFIYLKLVKQTCVGDPLVEPRRGCGELAKSHPVVPLVAHRRVAVGSDNAPASVASLNGAGPGTDEVGVGTGPAGPRRDDPRGGWRHARPSCVRVRPGLGAQAPALGRAGSPHQPRAAGVRPRRRRRPTFASGRHGGAGPPPGGG